MVFKNLRVFVLLTSAFGRVNIATRTDLVVSPGDNIETDYSSATTLNCCAPEPIVCAPSSTPTNKLSNNFKISPYLYRHRFAVSKIELSPLSMGMS